MVGKSTFLIFYTSFMTSALSAAQAPKLCEKDEHSHYLAKDAKEIQTQFEKLQFEENPNKFCNINLIRRFLEAHPNHKNVEKMSDDEVILKAKIEVEKEPSGFGDFVTLPFLEEKKNTFAGNVILQNDVPKIVFSKTSFEQTIEKASAMINHPNPCELDAKTDGADLSDVSKQSGMLPVFDSGLLLHYARQAGFPLLCSELVGLTNMSSCNQALHQNESVMKQKNIRISAATLMNQVINSKKYDLGLRIAANKILNYLKEPSKIKSNLFSDLNESFENAGYSKPEAEQLSFDVLGLIATGGSALSARIKEINFSGHRRPTIAALTTIASAMPLLDHLTAERGQMYTFPAGVKSSCDSSKAYHFWMAAYLSRESLQNGRTPEGAAAAAFTTAKLYPVLGNLTNRSHGAILLHRSFSPATQIVRVDLAYATAGSLFGAGLQQELNVDQGISMLIDNSGVLPKLSKKEVGNELKPHKLLGYSRFNEMFNPNSYYKSIDEKKFKPHRPVRIKYNSDSIDCK